MPGIDCAQEGEGFGAAQLAQDDSIGAHAKRGRYEVVGGRGRLAERAAGRDQADGIVVRQPDLGGVFDQDQPFLDRYFADQRIEEGRLTRRGAAGDQDVEPPTHRLAQRCRDIAGVDERSHPVDRRLLSVTGPSDAAERVGGHKSSSVRSADTCLRIAIAIAPRVAGGTTIWMREPSGRLAESKGCSRLIPWWPSAATCRARRASSAPSRAGTSWRSIAPPPVPGHKSPGRLITVPGTSARLEGTAEGSKMTW